MRIPDPFSFFSGGPLHRLDISIAEALTGRRGWSISRHTVDPAVRAGASPSNAVALLHWGIMVTFAVGVASTWVATSRRD